MMQDIETFPLPVIPSICDAMQFCQLFAALNEVTLKLENDDGDWIVQANRLRLEQVLVNLISNGIKYTKPGTDIVISVRQCPMKQMLAEALGAGTSDLKVLSPIALEALRRQRKVVTIVSVRDHGNGIPEDELENLFGEFVQLEISKEKDRNYDGGGGKFVGQSSGSGLGLNLSLKFVTCMNGHIWCKNDPGGGAVFSFCFPRGDESFCDEESSHTDSRHMHALELSKDDAEAFRVLVVDDSLINLKVLCRMLQRLGVHDIKACGDGSEALEYLESAQQPSDLPNIILSDLNMPTMNGDDLIRCVRKMEQYKSGLGLRAMACSADWTREMEVRCSSAGFDGVLRKPIVLSDLRDFLAQTAAELDGYGS